jgi:hypothetical protein
LGKEASDTSSPLSSFVIYCRFILETYFGLLSKGEYCDPADLFLLHKELYVTDGRYNAKWFQKTGVARFNSLLNLLKLENAVPISGMQMVRQEIGGVSLAHRVSAVWLTNSSPRAVVFVPYSSEHQCEWSYGAHFVHDWLRTFYQKIGTVNGNPCRVLFICADGNEFFKYVMHQVAVEESLISGAEAIASLNVKLMKEGKAALSGACPSKDCIFKARCSIKKAKGTNNVQVSEQDQTDS